MPNDCSRPLPLREIGFVERYGQLIELMVDARPVVSRHGRAQATEVVSDEPHDSVQLLRIVATRPTDCFATGSDQALLQ